MLFPQEPAHGGADGRGAYAHLLRHGGQLAQRLFEIPPDVVGERLERRDVDDLRPVLDPEIAVFAEMGERVVGCAIAIPDVNQVLKKMNGNLLPFGLWHFLRRKSIVDRARVILLGVLPEVRHLGLYPLLVADLFTRGAARGYRSAELSWTLEDNDEINVGIEAAGGRRTKVYRLFERELAAARA